MRIQFSLSSSLYVNVPSQYRRGIGFSFPFAAFVLTKSPRLISPLSLVSRISSPDNL